MRILQKIKHPEDTLSIYLKDWEKHLLKNWIARIYCGGVGFILLTKLLVCFDAKGPKSVLSPLSIPHP